MFRYIGLIVFLLFFNGCAGFGIINNDPLPQGSQSSRYGVIDNLGSSQNDDVILVLAFSGGGTRASALAYGVLEALRETVIDNQGKTLRLLDELDMISSVSGGSFTSAYYGLYRDQIFEDFQKNFLKKDVERDLLRRLLHPKSWFSSKARSESAVEYYEKSLFKGATFEDLKKRGKPLILINASDLGRGIRFSFIQEYFDLLCSDLNSFPVARAVTASSAVPILFSPVVVKNYSGCPGSMTEDYFELFGHEKMPEQVRQVVKGLKTYKDKDTRKYIHLVDGGITDNLGLMSIYEMVEVSGGIKNFVNIIGGLKGRDVLFISVNASTHFNHNMDASNKVPSIEDTVNTMTDVQLHRYNALSIDLMKQALIRWEGELSTPEAPVSSFFVKVDFDSLAKKEKAYVNRIPTSLSLKSKQVDTLIALGRELLFNNPEFQRFLKKNRVTSKNVTNSDAYLQ